MDSRPDRHLSCGASRDSSRAWRRGTWSCSLFPPGPSTTGDVHGAARANPVRQAPRVGSVHRFYSPVGFITPLRRADRGGTLDPVQQIISSVQRRSAYAYNSRQPISLWPFSWACSVKRHRSSLSLAPLFTKAWVPGHLDGTAVNLLENLFAPVSVTSAR